MVGIVKMIRLVKRGMHRHLDLEPFENLLGILSQIDI